MSDERERYSRLTYLAYGEFSSNRRAVVHEQCANFHEALQAGRSAEQAGEAFPPNARAAAVRAARAVRAFEAEIGEMTGASPTHVYRPEKQPWWSRWFYGGARYTVSSFCVGIQNHFVGTLAAQDAAIAAADALAELLTTLGGTEVSSAWMD